MLALPKEATIVLSTPLASISAIRTFLLGLFAFCSFLFSMIRIIQSEPRQVKKKRKNIFEKSS